MKRVGLWFKCTFWGLLGVCSLWGPETIASDGVLDIKTLEVTATAYNSVRGQTDDNPTLTAWGYTLEPGMKVIAVSKDLIKQGLTHGAWVLIDGVPGVFRVLDKMAPRWRKRIDIYMGLDIKAAREWGRKKVRIWWEDYSKAGLDKIKRLAIKRGLVIKPAVTHKPTER